MFDLHVISLKRNDQSEHRPWPPHLKVGPALPFNSTVARKTIRGYRFQLPGTQR